MSSISFPDRHDGQLLGQQVWAALAAIVVLIASFLLPPDLPRIPLRAYVPIHTTLEFLAILISAMVFATVWFTPTREVTPCAMIIASALIATAMLDFLHAMSIDGMAEFVTPGSSQKGDVFWIVARTCAATGFFVGAFLPRSVQLKPSHRNRLGIGFAVFALVVISVVLTNASWMPVFFVPGEGSTLLKSTWEAVLAGVMAVAALRYYATARNSGRSYNALIFGAVAFSALGELSSTSYGVANDAQNLLGHLYKLLSYWLMFQAISILSVRRPYERLAAQTRQLAHMNESLRARSLGLESTATPVLLTDVNGAVNWRNRASLALTPHIPEEQNNLFGSYFTPDPVDAIQMRNRLAAGEVWRGQVKMVLTNHNAVIMDRTVTPVRNAEGSVEAYVVVAENITHRVQAEARHKRILETALDGYWVVDAETRKLIEVNEAYARMSGYTTTELLNMHVQDLKLEEDLDAARRQAGYIRESSYGRYKSRHRKKDGGELTVEASVTYDAERGHYYAFIRDLTEQERAFAATQELERRLRHSQKMQALGQLTGGIAHDFNNTLASILGYSNLALTRFASDGQPKLARYLTEIVTASERARDLVLKMLAFTRTHPSEPASLIAPATVVEEVEQMLRPSIPTTIQLRCLVESEQPIRIEAEDLHQIMAILISNSRDAIREQGSIDIRVRHVSVDDAVCAVSSQRLHGEFLAVEVSDDGMGIDPKNLGNVFDPFFTTKDVGNGPGLGLSMVQGILRKCGGHVVVTSEPGRGSTFQLLFRGEPREALTRQTDENPATPVESRDTGLEVWVVDDEMAVAGFVRELLTDEGYRVRIFHDPMAALSAFKADHAGVHVVITDQTMPGLSGLQLVDLMRSIRKDLPVIVCTGYSDGIPASELQQHGVQKLLIKPVASNKLLQTITEVLADRSEAAK